MTNGAFSGAGIGWGGLNPGVGAVELDGDTTGLVGPVFWFVASQPARAFALPHPMAQKAGRRNRSASNEVFRVGGLWLTLSLLKQFRLRGRSNQQYK